MNSGAANSFGPLPKPAGYRLPANVRHRKHNASSRSRKDCLCAAAGPAGGLLVHGRRHCYLPRQPWRREDLRATAGAAAPHKNTQVLSGYLPSHVPADLAGGWSLGHVGTALPLRGSYRQPWNVEVEIPTAEL